MSGEAPPDHEVRQLVSVVILTSRDENSHPEAIRLASVFARWPNDFEAIVVHAGGDPTLDSNVSTSGARAVVGSDGAAARNRAARAARGDVILYIEHDTILDPSDVLAAATDLRASRAAAVIFTGEATPRLIDRCALLHAGGYVDGAEPFEDIELTYRLLQRGVLLSRKSVSMRHARSSGLFSGPRRLYRAGQRIALQRGLSAFPYPAIGVTKPIGLLQHIAHIAGALRPGPQVRRLYRSMLNDRVFEQEPHYEKKWYQGSAGSRHVDAAEKRVVGELLGKIPIMRALDLGHGGGRWTRWLAERYPNASIVSVDRSGAMNRALSMNPPISAQHRVAAGSFDSIPCPDRAVDLLLCIRSLKYASDLDAAMQEIARVVDDDAHAVIEMPNPNVLIRAGRLVPWFIGKDTYPQRITALSPKEFTTIAHGAGFDVLQLRRVFAVPARCYSLAKRAPVVRALGHLDRALPKRLFGRSDFYLLKRRPRRGSTHEF